MEVLDKGKAAAVTSIVQTKDKHSGKVIFENQSTVFIRGSGGFGGKRTGKGAASSWFMRLCTPPQSLALTGGLVCEQTGAPPPQRTSHRNASQTQSLRRRHCPPRPCCTGEAAHPTRPCQSTQSDRFSVASRLSGDLNPLHVSYRVAQPPCCMSFR